MTMFKANVEKGAERKKLQKINSIRQTATKQSRLLTPKSVHGNPSGNELLDRGHTEGTR